MDRKDALTMIASKSLPSTLKPSVVFSLLDVDYIFATTGALERSWGYSAEQAAEMRDYYQNVVAPACKATLRRRAGTSSTGAGRVENERG